MAEQTMKRRGKTEGEEGKKIGGRKETAGDGRRKGGQRRKGKLGSVVWSDCYWCMDIGVTEGSLQCSFILKINGVHEVLFGIVCIVHAEYRRSMFLLLYQEGVQSVLFSWRRIIAWMFNGLCTALIIFFIWGGIALWYLFLLAYGAMPPSISTTAYKVFVECLAPSPSFWIVTIFVVISAMIPYFAYAAIQMRFFPMHHGMIQWMRLECRTEDPE
ncbi:hypothetical protein Vadar_005029 [Vaccinium darrowii]|uniref:Uncharacterized protein n=1 Tax=Vaccinium darrowii TaxID=229202 RepID=A0ACB7XFG9_9ERIC|nr:hypothetical protein Vadar_005029 [Vaccinium darrowii]